MAGLVCEDPAVQADAVTCSITSAKAMFRVSFWIPVDAYDRYYQDTDVQYRISSAFHDWLEAHVASETLDALVDIRVNATGGNPWVPEDPTPSQGEFPLAELPERLKAWRPTT